MFEWIKENIINKKGLVIVDDLKDAMSGSTVKRILVKRDGEYRADRVIDCKVARTAGYEGSCAKMVIDLSGVVIADKTVPNLLQATLKIKMFNKFLGEYANANWALFGKPILAGFEIAENATDAEIAEALYIALFNAVPENNRFMNLEYTEGDTKVTITLPDCYADFESFALEIYDQTACDSCLGEYHRVALADDKVTITHNVEPFATGEWIRENLRFPSYPNMRYAPLYADEQPVPGAKYVMYSFGYRVENLPAGLNWAGERAQSDTRHIFYVLAGDVDAEFKAKLEEAGLTCVDDHFHTDENEEPLHKNPSEE